MDEQNPARAGRQRDGRDPDGVHADQPGPSGIGPDEIRRIWREHRRWVAAILLAHKPREADVEDLLQIVAAAVVRKIGDLRDPTAVKPWLRTVAINAARAAGREAKRSRTKLRLVGRPVESGGDDGRGEGGFEAGVSRAEEAERLMGLARSLPEGYREPLLMRCVRGMSYRQIGAVLDLPETTIETRIARGRRMLRELAAQDAEKRERATAGTDRAGAGTRTGAAAGV